MSDQTSDSMSEHEPSMEDILASIRKIIADDTPAVDKAGNGNTNITAMLGESPARSIITAAPLSGASAEPSASLTARPSVDVDALDLGGFDVDVDDDSTQEMLDLVDFDLSEPENSAVPDVASSADTEANDILDLTHMLDDPDVAHASNGSPVADITPLQEPTLSAEDADFDEMLNLVLDDDGADVVSSADDMADDAELSALLSDIDDIAETPAIDHASASAAVGDSTDLELDSLELEDLVGLDDLDIDGDFNNETDSDAALTAESEDDIDSMFGDMELDDASESESAEGETFDAEIPAEPERVIDPAESLLVESEAADNAFSDKLDDNDLAAFDAMRVEDDPAADPAIAAAATPKADEDIDLVKSLMAELTDDSYEVDGALSSDSSDDADILSDHDLEDMLDVSEPIDDVDAVLNDGLSGQGSDDNDLTAIIAEANAAADAAALDAKTAADSAAHMPVAEPDHAEPESEAKSGLAALLAGAAAATAGAGAVASVISDDDHGAEAVDIDDLSIEDMLDSDDSSELEPEQEEAFDALELFAAELSEDTPPENNAEVAPMADLEDINPIDPVNEDDDMPRIVKSDTITNEETAVAASGAFASLGDVVEQKTVLQESGPRIGDLVQEALKPMLQEWLDKNLKGIVDRAVAKEIKRISSGK